MRPATEHSSGMDDEGQEVHQSAPQELILTSGALAVSKNIHELIEQYCLYVTVVVDDSSSIQNYGNTADVVAWHNDSLASLSEHPRADAIYWRTRFLTAHSLLGKHIPVRKAPRLTERNYRPLHDTPLYDSACKKLISVGKQQSRNEHLQQGDRYVTFFLSDGADTASRTYSPDDVAHIAEKLLRTQKHIVGGMGVHDGSTNFQLVFQEMGIPPQWIHTISRSKRGFQQGSAMTSSSIGSASFGAGSFDSMSQEGFTSAPDSSDSSVG